MLRLSRSTRPPRDPDRTRALLLKAAFREIYEHGYQAASLDSILAKTRVTKGALYHHFRNKRALGYAVVEELIRRHIHQVWVDPLLQAGDPLAFLVQRICGRKPPGGFNPRLGCPLNNLAQEMSPLDEGFRRRIEAVFREWRQGIARALRRGQQQGCVRRDLDPEAAAAFCLAAMEGIVSLVKNSSNPALLRQGRRGLVGYLEGLRPPTPALPARA